MSTMSSSSYLSWIALRPHERLPSRRRGDLLASFVILLASDLCQLVSQHNCLMAASMWCRDSPRFRSVWVCLSTCVQRKRRHSLQGMGRPSKSGAHIFPFLDTLPAPESSGWNEEKVQ